MADWCFRNNDELSVNWDFIDINLLELVAEKLDAIDYIRFRAVCKTWRSISSIIPAGPLLPWLITGCDRVDGRLFYISFTDDKLHSIVVPALKENKSFDIGIVSCEGWLVLEGQHNCYAISLLNPLTGALVHLPQVPKQLFTRRIRYNMHFDPGLHPEATMNSVEIQYLIHRMAISSQPLTTAECVIVVISAGNKALVSLRMGVHGFSSWRLMNDEGEYEDVAFFQERFVAVNCFGEVSTFSAMNLNKLSTVPSPSTALDKIDWKLACVFDKLLLLFQNVSDCEGYASFQDTKVPFYKTRRANAYKLIRENSVGSPPLKFVEAKYPHFVIFYGISSRPYAFSRLFSGMPNFIYVAGEHGEVANNERPVSFVIMPQAFDINNATLKPLFPQIETNSIVSLWHMPRPF